MYLNRPQLSIFDTCLYAYTNGFQTLLSCRFELDNESVYRYCVHMQLLSVWQGIKTVYQKENNEIAIPTNAPGGLKGQRSSHFGHCDVFIVIDMSTLISVHRVFAYYKQKSMGIRILPLQ